LRTGDFVAECRHFAAELTNFLLIAHRVTGAKADIGLSALYQPSDWLTHDRPIAAVDRHDFPRRIDERVPGAAAVIENIVKGFECAKKRLAKFSDLPSPL
jgi:hypothetical protein